MVRSRLGLKALGLCALVLGLMGISAGAAQAEEGGEWNLAGKALSTHTAGLDPSVTATIVPATTASLLTEIIGKTVRFTCTNVTLVNTKLQVKGILSPGGSAEFTGCKTFLGVLNGEGKVEKEAESVPCEPFSIIGGKKVSGVVVTDKGKGLLALHTGGITTTVIEPEIAEKAFGTIHMGEFCSIGEEVPVFGKLVIQDQVAAQATEERVTHTIQALKELTKLYVISKTVEHEKTYVDGAAEAKLAGTHAGLKWSGKAK